MDQPTLINPQTGRLSAATVRHLTRLVGGDSILELQILRFIQARYGAKNLFHLPPHVAEEICKRPSDFIHAAKHFSQPELPF
jgi:hypothetical protein